MITFRYNKILHTYSNENSSRTKNNYHFAKTRTRNKRNVFKLIFSICRQSNYGQDVVLLNDSFRSTTGGSLPEADPALRPFTSVSPLNLIQTSHSH